MVKLLTDTKSINVKSVSINLPLKNLLRVFGALTHARIKENTRPAQSAA